jgi:hypothetical protein
MGSCWLNDNPQRHKSFNGDNNTLTIGSGTNNNLLMSVLAAISKRKCSRFSNFLLYELNLYKEIEISKIQLKLSFHLIILTCY